MISSNDIASVIAGQQQSLAASMQYAAQTSYSNMGGIGAYGNPFTAPPPMPQHHQLAHQAASFNYGAPTLAGYGFGNRMGALGLGGIAGAYSGLSMAAGIGGAAASMGIGPGWMRAIAGGGGIAGMGASMGIGMIGSHIAGNMMQGAQEQAGIYSTLGQFNFNNSASRTGRGFDRQNAKAIADFTREMSHMPELMTSMSELNRIMNSLGGMGVMNGLRDAKEFNRKFQESITTLKDMAKIMSTSMENAVQFFNEARRSGIYDSNGMKQNAFNRQMVAGVTGMNQQQIGQLQYAGSQMSFGMGGSRGAGANHVLRNAQQIGMANEMGIFSDKDIMEYTGESGATGIGMMAQSLTQAGYAMSRSSLGTAMALAVGAQDKRGKFTGGVDDEMVKRIRSGGISKSELLSLARQKAHKGGRNSMISFAAHRDHITAETAGAVGVEGMALELQDIIGERGFKGDDVMNLVMQRFHVDEKTAGMVTKYMNKLPEIQQETAMRGQTEARRIGTQSHMNENYSMEALKKKIHLKMEHTLTEPFKKIGADLSHAISKRVEDFVDDFFDNKSVEISAATSKAVASAMSGSSTGRGQVMADIAGLSSFEMQAGRMSRDKTFSGAKGLLADLSGHQSGNMLRASTLMTEGGRFGKRSGVSGAGRGYNTYGQQAGGISKFFGGKGDFVLQNDSMGADWVSHLKQIGEGKVNVDLDGASDDMSTKLGVGFMRSHTSEIINKNSGELRNMTQEQRLDFIKQKLVEAGGNNVRVDKTIDALSKKGLSFSSVLDKLQKESGSSGIYGSFNAGKMADEISGSFKGSFGNVTAMAKLIDQESTSFSGQFGDKSAVGALMKKDSPARDLFLTASDPSATGHAEAKKLLTAESLPTQEREELMRKFGISEGELGGLSKAFMSSGGKTVEGADRLRNALKAGSYAGIAKQIREQGYDITGRLTGSKIQNTLVRDSIGRFAAGLSGIDSPEALSNYVKEGGGVHNVLEMVEHLKGSDRSAAMGVLGDGASAGFDAKARYLRTGQINSKLLEDEDVQKYIKDRGGKKGIKGLSDKDREGLGDMVRDKTYAGSLAYKGNMQGKEMGNEFMTKLNEFARTSTQFAQLVIDATPALAANVQAAANKHVQAGEDLQSKPGQPPPNKSE